MAEEHVSLPTPSSLLEKQALRLGVNLLGVVLTAAYLGSHLNELASASPLVPLDRGQGERRFGGIGSERRRALYAELVETQPLRVARARAKFPTHVWSQYDDTANSLTQEIVFLARREGLHYTQLALIFDEGVRNGWKSFTGAVIPPIWEPLNPRTQ